MLMVQLAVREYKIVHDKTSGATAKSATTFRRVEVPNFVDQHCAAAQQFFTTRVKQQ